MEEEGKERYLDGGKKILYKERKNKEVKKTINIFGRKEIGRIKVEKNVRYYEEEDHVYEKEK